MASRLNTVATDGRCRYPLTFRHSTGTAGRTHRKTGDDRYTNDQAFGGSVGDPQKQRDARGRDIIGELAKRQIVVMARSRRTVSEEMPDAYKDVSEVVDACEQAGLSRRVDKLVPLGCIKG